MKTTLYSGGQALVLEYIQSGEKYDFRLNDQAEKRQVRLVSARDGALTLIVDDKPVQAHVAIDGERILVAIEGDVYEFTRGPDKQGRTRKGESGSWDSEIRSPMPGKILELKVAEGDEVEANQTLVLLEAMKMENTLATEGKAKVRKIHVAQGELVELGQLLIELDPVASNE